jgi:hypothetical protein
MTLFLNKNHELGLFETIDRPASKPLPATPYEYARWKKARVNIDYHLNLANVFWDRKM